MYDFRRPPETESWKLVIESTAPRAGQLPRLARQPLDRGQAFAASTSPWRGVTVISTLSALVNVFCSDSNASSSGFSVLKNIR